MPDINRQELKGHSAISPTTIYGWPSILFSLPFMGAGVFIFLLAIGIIPAKPSDFHASRGSIAAIGCFFFLAGFSFLVHGLLSLRQRVRIKGLQSKYGGDIWYADYHWDPRGVKGDSLSKVISMFFSGLGITLVTLLFTWLAFVEIKLLFFKIVIGIFDFFLLLLWGNWIYLVGRFLKYGISSLEFHQFPYFLGEKVDVTLKATKKIKGLKEMTAILRCIEERYETRGSGENAKSVVVSYQIYADRLALNDVKQYEFMTLSLPISFNLPEGQEYETALRNRPAKYWELEIKAQTPGIDYKTSFLLPVYAKR